MNNFENQIRAVRLGPPSANLNRRVEELFVSAVKSRPAVHRRLWWMLLPVVGALAASFVITSRRQPPPLVQSAVYQIEAKGLMRDWLLTPPAESLTPPAMIVTVQ